MIAVSVIASQHDEFTWRTQDAYCRGCAEYPRRCWSPPTRSRAPTARSKSPRRSGGVSSRGGRPIDLCPVADGGEGTLAALFSALERRGARGHRLRSARAPGPGALRARGEAAGGAAGDRRMRLRERPEPGGGGRARPDRGHHVGTGELIAAALEAGATDGLSRRRRQRDHRRRRRRARAIRARMAGWTAPGSSCYATSARRSRTRPGCSGRRRAPTPAGRDRLTTRLHAQARRFRRDPRGLPMTGAAGGLLGGLWAALGAELSRARRTCSTRSASTRGCAPRARSSPARASSTPEPRRQGRLRGRDPRAPGRRAVLRRRREPWRSTPSALRILDLQLALEAGTPDQLEAAGRRLAELI